MRDRAAALFPEVVGVVAAGRLADVRLATDAAPSTFTLTDDAGGELRVRLDAVPLSRPLAGRTFANTSSDSHVIQLSDRLAPEAVGAVLAGEVASLVLIRENARVGTGPARGDVLRPGASADRLWNLSARELSDADRARLAQLDWLAGRASGAGPEAARARADFSAALDQMGLRETGTSANDAVERRQVLENTLLATGHLGPGAAGLLRELGRPIVQLPPADAEALRAYRTSAADVPVEEYAAAPPAPGSGTPVEPYELFRQATRAELRRDAASRRTLARLRAEARDLPPGRYPRRPLMLGGGAALAGRDPDVLLVDARGRWHTDPIGEIVQSADQVRGIYDTGMGDPYLAAAPRDRVPLEAVRLWEDDLAASGPVADAHCRLLPGDDGTLIAELTPLDGSDPVRVEVEGTPLLATGVPPERIPGCSREAPTLPDVVRVLADHLDGAGSDGARQARDRLLDRPDRSGGAGAVRAALTGTGVAAALEAADDPAVQGALRTLDSIERWEDARSRASGKVLFGDDVRGGSYDPRASDTWIVAGLGGTGMATAEVILRGNPGATVYLIGSRVAPVVESNPQHLAIRERHDRAMGGDGRLELLTGHRLGAIDMGTGPSGQPVFRAGGVTAEGYVACMGRVPRLPQAVQPLADWALDNGGALRGDLMFDRDRQYLGYRVEFEARGTACPVEVTGAASRMLPEEVFDRSAAGLVNRLGEQEIPPESANVAAGFMATAAQARRLREARATGITVTASPVADGEPPDAAPARACTGGRLDSARQALREARDLLSGDTPSRRPDAAPRTGRAAPRHTPGPGTGPPSAPEM